jgi:hypothetical protein
MLAEEINAPAAERFPSFLPKNAKGGEIYGLGSMKPPTDASCGTVQPK